jgi:hypothetical protein
MQTMKVMRALLLLLLPSAEMPRMVRGRQQHGEGQGDDHDEEG